MSSFIPRSSTARDFIIASVPVLERRRLWQQFLGVLGGRRSSRELPALAERLWGAAEYTEPNKELTFSAHEHT